MKHQKMEALTQNNCKRLQMGVSILFLAWLNSASSISPSLPDLLCLMEAPTLFRLRSNHDSYHQQTIDNCRWHLAVSCHHAGKSG
jgi:hypothetical protein